MEKLTEFMPCTCSTPEHHMLFDLWDWGPEDLIPSNPEDCVHLEMTVFLHDGGFWYRLKRAVKYLFGYKCQKGQWDGMAVDYATAGKMMETLQSFRNRIESYRYIARKLRDSDDRLESDGNAGR